MTTQPTPITESEIAELEAMHAATTKGHWQAFPSCVSATTDRPDEPHAQWAFLCSPYASSFCFEAAQHEKPANLASIAALHNALPRLAEAAREGIKAEKYRKALVDIGKIGEDRTMGGVYDSKTGELIRCGDVAREALKEGA